MVAQGQGVVGVDAGTVGSDRGVVRPMLKRIARRYRRLPHRHLVDGGFTKAEDIEWAARFDVEVFCPAIRNKHNTAPYAPRPDDSPGVAAWRARMRGAEGKRIYRRPALGECINAPFRNSGPNHFTPPCPPKLTTLL